VQFGVIKVEDMDGDKMEDKINEILLVRLCAQRIAYALVEY